MKFIRKNGRIVPIRDNKSSSTQKAGRVIKGASKDALAATTGTTLMLHIIEKRSKFYAPQIHGWKNNLTAGLKYGAIIGGASLAVRGGLSIFNSLKDKKR